MCTLTWLIDSTAPGYQLFFNRDELRTRLTAQPPSQRHGNGVHFIAPIDSDALGTWISVNEFGVSLCLLNHYQAQQQQNSLQQAWRSRGLLVLDLAHHSTAKDTEAHLLQMDLSQYRAFRLLIFNPFTLPVLYSWNGQLLTAEQNPQQPVTSSSFQSQAVQDGRVNYFNQLQPKQGWSAESLTHYQSSHQPQRSAYSVCMHRDDACTQSFSQIEVSQSQVTMRYANGAPCETALSEPIALALKSTLPLNQSIAS